MSRNDVYLASKPRYEILDGLRGVAALLVVAFHLFETYSKGPEYQIINHGYLAVDFFFVLSGFVIGYAYDDRWGKMSMWNFFKRRLVRLHPLVIYGTVIGALLFYFGDCPAFSLIKDTPWYAVLLVMLFVFTMLPLPSSMDIRGWGETNPLNGPAWSLQWEYIANIMYAFFIRRFPKKVLAVCVVAFGALTVMLCMNVDVFGVLKVREYAAYTVIGGWSTTPDQLLIGITRLLYPFFCGLLLSRVGRFIKVRGAFWWCSLLIVVMLAMPSFGVGETRWLNGVYEALCIIVLFPLVVMMGAGSGVGGSRSSAVNNFLGNISYPLYITHFPLVYMQMGWVHNHEDAPLGMHIFVSVSVYVLAVISAYVAYRLYDLPVRAWLKAKLFKAA